MLTPVYVTIPHILAVCLPLQLIKRPQTDNYIIIMDTNKGVVEVGFMKVFKFCGKSLHQHGHGGN